ncbi:DUF397 domain-containing protein [Nocardia sp. 2]|uniref:DUF397 domain-containing protein n=1 Tax=Nocardia acididurans TaxID=2802282 RepID=A0ABS1MIK6_9NOCA|nr:DUF397 domain-containing protein [Nocardia acididurans]
MRNSGAPEMPPLVFTEEEWTAFLEGARNGEFARSRKDPRQTEVRCRLCGRHPEPGARMRCQRSPGSAATDGAGSGSPRPIRPADARVVRTAAGSPLTPRH